MKHILNTLLYSVFLVFFISCKTTTKNETSKEQNTLIDNKSTQEKPLELNEEEILEVHEKSNEKYQGFKNYHYENEHLPVYSDLDIKSKVIASIKPYETIDQIIHTGEYVYSETDDVKEWIKITTTQGEKNIEGYVVSNRFNFETKYEENSTTKFIDTFFVHNEKEFINALGSNRVIIVKAKTLDISAHLEKTKKIDFIPYNKYEQDLKHKEKTTLGEFYYVKEPEYNLGFFILHGYNNLLIEGYQSPVTLKRLDQEQQFPISNCKNIYINNVCFEGKNSKLEITYEEGEDPYILNIENSENINFNNLKINAFNNGSFKIKNSENVNIDNSKINRFSGGIFVANSENVKVDHSFFIGGIDNYNLIDFSEDDNDINKLSIENSLVYKSKLFSLYSTGNNKDLNNTLSLVNLDINTNSFEEGVLVNKNSTYVYVDYMTLKNNELKKPFITTSGNINMYFYNSNITQNISKDSSYVFNYDWDKSGNITFRNTKMYANNGFLALSKHGTVSDWVNLDKKSRVSNIYLSDTTLTKHNRAVFNNEDYIERNISYDKERNVLYKSGILKDGKYNFSNRDLKPYSACGDCHYFEDMHKNFLRDAYGEVRNGKVDGEWNVVNYKNDSIQVIQKLTYKAGILEGLAQKYIVKDKKVLVEEGTIVNEKKEGEWKTYYPNGILQKKEHFEKGRQTGSLSVYYLDGTLMEHREHYYNRNGKTSFYYPNGQLESEITYKKGEPTLENSKFYNKKGQPREGTLTYVVKERKGLPYKVDVDLKDKQYKDYNIVKGRIYLWRHLPDYKQLKDGKPFGIQRYDAGRVKRYDYRSMYGDISFQVVAEFLNEKKLTSDKYIFYDNFDLYQTWFYDQEKKKNILTEYNGVYGLPQLKEEYTQIGDSLVRHGVSRKLDKYGVMSRIGYYDQGKKAGNWIYYNNDYKAYKKEVYEENRLIETKRMN